MTLGKLENVDVRTVWETEAGKFTPWLAQSDNIRLLGGKAKGSALEL